MEGNIMGHEKKNEGQQQAITPQQLRQIQELAETIRYGSITLVFQDGILIQIDKSEKIRIPKT
jgi:hypothetical protein